MPARENVLHKLLEIGYVTARCTAVSCLRSYLDSRAWNKWMSYFVLQLVSFTFSQLPLLQSSQVSAPFCISHTLNRQEINIAIEDHLSYVKEEYNKTLEEYTRRERELEILHGQVSEQNGDEHQVQEILASSETEMLELEGRLHALRSQTNEVALYQEKVTQSEQNLITSKIMYFKVQDQAEKYRVLIKEHAQETEKFRKKYLKTQQAIDELRRQIEVKETESNHIHNQVSMEISLVQSQFQEQLQLLSSIPDAVNKLQLQVQEEEQQWCMAEYRRRELLHELYDAKQQMDCYTSEISDIQTRLQESKDEQKELHKQLKDCEKENDDLQSEVSALKTNTEIMLSEYELAEKNTKEKINEITQLSKKLETYSDDFSHELSRAKNQNEKNRIALQIKMSQLDDELLQLRTFAKVMEKDRDQVKMDLQSHINWLTEKNDEAVAIINNLEMQLNSSHSNDNNFHTAYISMAN